MVFMRLMVEGMSLGPDHDEAGREKINQREENGSTFNPRVRKGDQVYTLVSEQNRSDSRNIIKILHFTQHDIMGKKIIQILRQWCPNVLTIGALKPLISNGAIVSRFGLDFNLIQKIASIENNDLRSKNVEF